MKPKTMTDDVQSAVQNAHDYLSNAGVLDHPAASSLREAFQNTGLVDGGKTSDGSGSTGSLDIALNPWTTDPDAFIQANNSKLQTRMARQQVAPDLESGGLQADQEMKSISPFSTQPSNQALQYRQQSEPMMRLASSSTSANIPLPSDNPNGKGIVLYVHGSLSNHETWTPNFIRDFNKTYTPMHQEYLDWDSSPARDNKSGIGVSGMKGLAPEDLLQKIEGLRQQFPGQPVMVVGHSNGGNVAVQASYNDPAMGPDYIIRFGSPIVGDLTPEQMAGLRAKVLDVYDPTDTVRSRWSFIEGGGNPTPHDTNNWHGYSVDAPLKQWNPLNLSGIPQHLSEHSPEVWDQIQVPLGVYGFMNKEIGGRPYNPRTSR